MFFVITIELFWIYLQYVLSMKYLFQQDFNIGGTSQKKSSSWKCTCLDIIRNEKKCVTQEIGANLLLLHGKRNEVVCRFAKLKVTKQTITKISWLTNTFAQVTFRNKKCLISKIVESRPKKKNENNDAHRNKTINLPHVFLILLLLKNLFASCFPLK